MWQKRIGIYHLLLDFAPNVEEGELLQTACGNQIQVRHKNQQASVWYLDRYCKVCFGVWRLCFTSVDDARETLKKETDKKVLKRALEVARQSTLRKAIEIRIRKLEKGGA